jgi:hypothetical protein
MMLEVWAFCMRNNVKTSVVVSLLVAAMTTATAAADERPAEISVAYSLLDHSRGGLPSESSLPIGWEVGLTLFTEKRVAIEVLGTGDYFDVRIPAMQLQVHNRIHGVFGGTRIGLTRSSRINTFTTVSAGVTNRNWTQQVEGSLQSASGYKNYMTTQLGAGVQLKMSSVLVAQIAGDYRMTLASHLLPSTFAINEPRLSFGISYRLRD